MKTTTDIAQFVKRNDNHELKVMHDGKVFIVKYGEMSARSQYLDDALESIAEETRRRANGMQTMRETKVEPAPVIAPPVGTTTGTYATPFQASPSISQAAQQAYQQQAATAPKCSNCKDTGWVHSTFFGQLPCGACNAYLSSMTKVTP